MPNKNLLLPAVSAAVLVAGGAAGYFYLRGPARDGTTPLAIAKTVPDEAYMAAFISSDPQSWEKLQQFGTPEAKQVVTKGLQRIEQDLLAKSNISFDKDVKPWVGNGMIAFLPNEASPAKAQAETPRMLVVVNIRDKIAAMQFAGKLAAQGGNKSKESEYKGNKVIVGENNSTYAAVVKDYLVIASDQQTLESAINTSQGEPSLASKPGAETALKGTEVSNAIAQVYLIDYSKAVQQMMASSDSEMKPAINTKELDKVQSLVAGIGVDDSGLRMKATISMKSNAPKFDYQPVPGKVVSLFPSDTFAMLSGGNISQIWSQATEQAKSDPAVQDALNTARTTVRMANFDLDKDIFSWMNGEFGLALIPSEQGILSQVGFGGVMVFSTSDRKTAEATLAKLDDMAKSNAVLVGQRDVQGKRVTEWNTPMGALLGHGWLDDNSLFIALGGPMVDVITGKPSSTLETSETFKSSTSSLSKQNLGYFYLDMDRTMSLVNRFAAMNQSPIPPESAAVLSSIKGIGLTSSQVNASTGQMDVLFSLKKAK